MLNILIEIVNVKVNQGFRLFCIRLTMKMKSLPSCKSVPQLIAERKEMTIVRKSLVNTWIVDCYNELEVEKCKCPHCPKEFLTRKRMKVHALRHRQIEVKMYGCRICGQQFRSGTQRNIHERRHIAEKPFECDICERKFDVKSCLTDHLKSHDDRKPYGCNFCATSYKDKGNLKLHLKVHEERSKYKFDCPICKTACATKGRLEIHRTRKQHFSEQENAFRFSCPTCKKSFGQLEGVRTHQDKEKHFVNKDKFGVNKFLCLYCNKVAFSTKSQLKDHLKQKHLSAEKYSCFACKKFFTSLQGVKYHRENAHCETEKHSNFQSNTSTDNTEESIKEIGDLRDEKLDRPTPKNEVSKTGMLTRRGKRATRQAENEEASPAEIERQPDGENESYKISDELEVEEIVTRPLKKSRKIDSIAPSDDQQNNLHIHNNQPVTQKKILQPNVNLPISTDSGHVTNGDSSFLLVSSTNNQSQLSSYENYKCSHCDQQFPNRIKYKHHIRKEQMNRTLKHECKVCGLEFKTLSRMRAHRRLAHANYNHSLTFCST